MTTSLTAAGTPACCSVTAFAWRAFTDQPTICDAHRAEGWGIYPGARGDDLDRLRAHPCGCLGLSLAGRVIEKCQLHAIGWRACCLQATRTRCVCAESYSCPEHGAACYGTHD